MDGITLRGTTGTDWVGQWLPGDYRVNCDAGGIVIEPRTFRVVGTARGNTQLMRHSKITMYDATAKSISFLELGYNLPPLANRKYYAAFVGTPRFIGTEVRIEVKAADKPRPFTYTCHYITARGQVIGRGSLNVVIQPGTTSLDMVVSWGHLGGNSWRSGQYYAECDANGVFLAGRFFEVERR